MALTIGLIIAALLAVALCIALIVGIAELVNAVHRIENALERIEELAGKAPAEKAGTPQPAPKTESTGV